jgi:hypothetical protein
MVGFLDVRNQIHILHHGHDQHLLVRISPGIRVRENIEQPIGIKRQNNVLIRNAS